MVLVGVCLNIGDIRRHSKIDEARSINKVGIKSTYVVALFSF